jgi:AhpD family alkylhydroperoxidase
VTRLRPIADEEVTPAASALLEHARLTGAPDPAMAAIFVRSDVGIAYLRLWNRLTGVTDLPLRLKELVRIRVAIGRQCGYCASVRSRAAAAEGVTEDLIAEMLDYEFSDQFSAAEKTALKFADIYKDEPARVAADDSLWLELKRHFTEVQIIELCIFLTLNVGGGRMTQAADLVSWEQACELRPKLREVMQRKAERDARRSITSQSIRENQVG